MDGCDFYRPDVDAGQGQIPSVNQSDLFTCERRNRRQIRRDPSGKKSIDAVMHNVDQPAGGFECSEWPPEALVATKAIALGNLYTDSSKAGNGCTFPSSRGPVWFGSYFSGQGSETDYAITLSYDTNDVNALPKKGAPELTLVFRQVAQMLKTLQLKPPMIISKVDPDS